VRAIAVLLVADDGNHFFGFENDQGGLLGHLRSPLLTKPTIRLPGASSTEIGDKYLQLILAVGSGIRHMCGRDTRNPEDHLP
jgi:hypothetical protein